MSIKQSVLNLISVADSQQAVDQFCREQFKKHFSNSPNRIGSLRGYKGFELINDKKIRINYSYVSGDMVFNDYFIVKIPNNL